MIRNVLIRLLNLIPVLVGISFLSFLLMRLSPGDFLSQMSLNPQVSPEIIAKLRSLYGLDQPLPVQYVKWVEALARGGVRLFLLVSCQSERSDLVESSEYTSSGDHFSHTVLGACDSPCHSWCDASQRIP